MTIEIPSNGIVIRFGMTTPYWPLSTSYGLIFCPVTNKVFHSPDQYLAYKMLAKSDDKARVLRTPNGYLAHVNLLEILRNPEALDPYYEESKEEVWRNCLMLKYTQSPALSNMLMRTGDRPIYDTSRRDDLYACYADGEGQNKHAFFLEELRAKLLAGDVIPEVARPPAIARNT